MNMRGLAPGSAQRSAARVAGGLYLFALVTAIFASFYVRGSLVVWGDPVATAANIAASAKLFRAGLAVDLLSFASIVVLALALHVLLKPVNSVLAQMALLWWVGEAVILAVNALNGYMVLILLGGADYLSVFQGSEREALVQVFLQAHLTGYNIGLIFFGLGSVVFSYLLLRSRYVPRVLAGLGIVASLLILLGTFAILIVPGRDAMIYQIINPPIALYELLIGSWLLFRGVRVPLNQTNHGTQSDHASPQGHWRPR